MTAFNDLEYAEVEVPPVLAAQLTSRADPAPASMKDAMERAFATLMAFVQRHGLVPSGQPRSIYTSYGPEGLSFIVVIPVASAPTNPPESGPETVATIPGGPALRFTHHGPYAALATTYNRITKFMQDQGLMQTEADWARYMPMWEEYLNDPDTTPEAELRTYIFLPRV